uniref:Uncharacterized protein n=1 Tax=Amphiprion ocellaris TaxID=80972 RepID=A0A3Q1ATV3_AMPOC
AWVGKYGTLDSCSSLLFFTVFEVQRKTYCQPTTPQNSESNHIPLSGLKEPTCL